MTTNREPEQPQTGPDRPAILDVRQVALQEIDRIVGNEATLGEDEVTRLRGVLFAALSERGAPS